MELRFSQVYILLSRLYNGCGAVALSVAGTDNDGDQQRFRHEVVCFLHNG